MTLTDAPEWLAFVVLGWFAATCRVVDLRPGAMSTVLALAVIHLSALRAGEAFGAGIGGPVVVAIAASVSALGHLMFRYSAHGLAIGLILCVMVMLSGLAVTGILPITYRQGLGLDYWSLFTALNYGAIAILAHALWRAHHGRLRRVA